MKNKNKRYCEICNKLLGKYAYYYGHKRCKSHAYKKSVITKLRKNKHFEDFVDKKTAARWRVNISKATKGRVISKKHRLALSSFFSGKQKSEEHKAKLKKSFYKFLKNHKKEFLQRYKNRHVHTETVNKIRNNYVSRGFIEVKWIRPDIVFKKNNKLYFIEVEKYGNKNWVNKTTPYCKLGLIKNLRIYDINCKKVTKKRL